MKLPLNKGEYYWIDLIGLRVVTEEGVELGQVERLLETGANDVLVVQGERERLIPFLIGLVVKQIDLTQGLMMVDWDPDF
jgi:16S rRNA processing protein RimM